MRKGRPSVVVKGEGEEEAKGLLLVVLQSLCQKEDEGDDDFYRRLRITTRCIERKHDGIEKSKKKRDSKERRKGIKQKLSHSIPLDIK